ncbi:MAG TPA: ATP-binding protein [Chthonomonadaceae bacterium]|nr:ATP-binding protein [Chthonomonadaceae bacterium]
MSEEISQANLKDIIAQHARTRFAEHQLHLHCRIDRMFALLMLIQWLAAIGAALWLSPRTWAGVASQTHYHVWAALFLGGAITLYPVFLAWQRPGATWTRHIIAIGQLLMSGLLIHLTGGRIETHFHVFGSLAFLAFYRDWRVLITGTAVTAVDHIVRGAVFPQSVYGIQVAEMWRWLEHAGWVIFEDIFLIISCQWGLRELNAVCERDARLEASNTELELKVEARTAALRERDAELEAINLELERKVEARTAELHEAEEQLIQSAKLASLGTLSAGIAHELNQPIAIIRGLSQQLQGEPNLSEDVMADLELIEGQTSRMTKIVKHLRTFCRAGGSEFSQVDVNQVVRDCFLLVGEQLRTHNVNVSFDLCEAAPPVLADANELEQVFLNLITNSRDALEERPDATITIRTRVEEGQFLLEFRDNGTGVPDVVAGRIFDPFFTTKEPGKGTGLGLSISLNIIKRHQGGIQVYNDNGAVFLITLPLPDTQELEWAA